MTASTTRASSPSDVGPPPPSWADAFVMVALVAMVGLAYANSFIAPFVFDGIPLSRNLQLLHWDQPLRWITLRPRFVGYLTFDINYTLHGDDLRGYHAVNLAIHIASGFCLYAIARRYLAVPYAACAAAVFLLHPMQTQSVTYLYQRFEALMAMFLIMGLLCLIRATESRRPLPWLVVSFACFLLSTCSKEVGVVAPLVYLWFDGVFLSATWKGARGLRTAFHIMMIGSLGLGGLVVYALRKHYASGGLLCADQVGVLEYVLTQPGVVLHYLRQFLLPLDLCVDEAWPLENRYFALACAIVGTIAGGVALVWLAYRHPRLGFLAGTPLLILAPTSSLAPIVDVSFTHRTYAALAPLAVLVALALKGAIATLPPHLRPRIYLVTVVTLAGLLTLATAWRNTVFANSISFWGDVVAKAPHNLRGLSNLGLALEDAGDKDAASAYYRRAASLWFEAAEPSGSNASRVLRGVPGRFTAVVTPLLKLGIQATDAGDLAEATRLFEALVRLPRLPTASDEPAKIFYNYALLLRKSGKPREAETALRRVLSTNGSYGSAYNELALLLADEDRLEEAIGLLTTALALPLPAERRARYAYNLASIHAEIGNQSAAERCLQIACTAAPSQTAYVRALEALRRGRSIQTVGPAPAGSAAVTPEDSR